MAERQLFDSWKEIARYLGRDVRTCQRYETELGLPVHRLDESAKARVFAYKDEIDAWREKPSHDGIARASSFWALLRRRLWVAVASLLLVAASGSVWLIVRSRVPLRPPAMRPTLAVLPFTAELNPESPKAWAESLPRFLIQSLARTKYFDVASEDRVIGELRALDWAPSRGFSTADLEHVARSLRATHTITGALVRAGNGFVISLTVQRPGTGESYPSRFECENEAALVKAIDRMAFQIKLDLGLTRSQAAGDFDAMGMEVTTESFEAFRLYNEGRRLHVGGDFAGSIRIMNLALELDPDFALALRSIAASMESMEDRDGAMTYYERAITAAASSNASDKERFWILSDYFGLTNEYAKGIETCRQWAARYPEDTQALQVMGRMYIFSEDAEGARRALDLGLEKGDLNPYAFYWSICARRMAQKLDEADRLYERALSVHPKNRLIIQAGVENALARGSFDQALAEAGRHGLRDQAISLAGTVGNILVLKGDFAGAQRQYERLERGAEVKSQALSRLALAQGQFARASELAREGHDPLLVAYIEMRCGRLGQGLAEVSAALNGARGRSPLFRVLALQVNGMIEVAMGDLPKARETAARLNDRVDGGIESRRHRHERFLTALIDAASGEHEAARANFEEALSLFPPETSALLFRWQDLFYFYAAQEEEKVGDFGGAERLYRKLLALLKGRLGFPDLTALSHYALGRIADARGDVDGARRSYKAFLEMWRDADPGLPEVDAAKGRLAALESAGPGERGRASEAR